MSVFSNPAHVTEDDITELFLGDLLDDRASLSSLDGRDDPEDWQGLPEQETLDCFQRIQQRRI